MDGAKVNGGLDQTTLRKTRQPATRWTDVYLVGSPVDLANPKHPAGSDPRNQRTLLRMEDRGGARK